VLIDVRHMPMVTKLGNAAKRREVLGMDIQLFFALRQSV
jgi:hypothetical protein